MAAAVKAILPGAGNAVSSFVLSRPLRLSQRFNNFTLPISRSLCCRSGLDASEFIVKEEGEIGTIEYRMFFVDKSGQKKSIWHDVPLQSSDGIFNFVVEIPKDSRAKMEVSVKELHNPIKQDRKHRKLRFYPYDIKWNYGMIPQTWEDPGELNPDVKGAFGDCDPVDVVEIGETRMQTGQIVRIKPLAALALIDREELDWKVVAISLDDPKAALVNDVADVEEHFPGTITAITDWFRDYRVPDGKRPNKYGFNDQPVGKDYALKVIDEANKAWAELKKGNVLGGGFSVS